MRRTNAKTDIQRASEYLLEKKIIFSQQDIVDKTGYGKGTVSQYLSDDGKPSKKFIEKFEDVFKLKLEDFKQVSPKFYTEDEEIDGVLNDPGIGYEVKLSAAIKKNTSTARGS